MEFFVILYNIPLHRRCCSGRILFFTYFHLTYIHVQIFDINLVIWYKSNSSFTSFSKEIWSFIDDTYFRRKVLFENLVIFIRIIFWFIHRLFKKCVHFSKRFTRSNIERTMVKKKLRHLWKKRKNHCRSSPLVNALAELYFSIFIGFTLIQFTKFEGFFPLMLSVICETLFSSLNIFWPKIVASSLDGKRKLRALSKLILTNRKAVTSNNKIKFSITCFPWIFVTFSLPFSYEIKLYMKRARKSRMSLETFKAGTFNGCYDKICTTKWFDL